MVLGDRIQNLRRQRGMSQEDLAQVLGVSRQSVSRWESGYVYPETDRLIALSDFFNVTLDSLVKEGEIGSSDEARDLGHTHRRQSRFWDYEYKSERTLFGMPLVHVNIGAGFRRAKGIFAVGNIATGFVSLGLASFGIISIGLASLGLVSLATFSLGLLLSIGVISIGTFSIGAIAIGIFALGAVSIGMFSTGALAVASHIAVGSHAYGHIAIGREVAEGVQTFWDTSNRSGGFFMVDVAAVRAAILEEFPTIPNWIVRLMMLFLRNG